jgi:rubrerythrin
MEFKVRLLDGVEEKGVAQVEQELLEKHEQEINKDTPAEIVNTPEEVQEVPAEQEDDLDEQKVLSYIGKRYNKQINSFDELVSERKESDPLPEDVSTYLKYKKETGRGFEDFIKLNKDYESMDSDELLRSYLATTQEGLDDDDIDILMDDYRYDEDIDDESRIKKVKIEKKKLVAEAKKFFNSQKEKYKIPLESSFGSISEEDKQELDAYKQYVQQAKTIEEENSRKRQWFEQKTNELFDGEFKGFEFNVNNKKIVFNPGDSSELKKIQSTPQNFINKFLDENGLMKDAVGYHKSLAIAMNPEKFAKHFYEQGLADATEGTMKNIKNINMSEQKVPEVSKSGGMQIREVTPSSGKSLKIRSIKKI